MGGEKLAGNHGRGGAVKRFCRQKGEKRCLVNFIFGSGISNENPFARIVRARARRAILKFESYHAALSSL
jgi:hypothetical protein